MRKNIILNTDSYKFSHWRQYPPGTEYVYSYIESRGGEFDRHVFFGLQMFLMEYLCQPITQEDIDEAQEYVDAHIGPGIFNREGWEYILKEHDGYLPLEMRAVEEGTVLPNHNVLVTLKNTDPKCFWLPGHMETAVMRAVWDATTVCTISYTCKTDINEALIKSCDDPAAELPFKLHDFGARGVSSLESAGIGGCAHLVNFMGTDTVEALRYARKYYGEKMAGFSVPAAEHSTITSWVDGGREDLKAARLEGEIASYRNMLRQFGKPNAIVAVVSDSYDIYNAVENIWGGVLKDEVIAMGGRLVVRPDSGDPATVVLRCVELLGKTFGYTVNKKGFKVLHPSVRVLQGDGINVHSIPGILKVLLDAEWSAENIGFGMGGGLLQLLNRDTMKFAMKCSAIQVNGVWHDVYKDPATDYGKYSKRGQLALITEDGVYQTVPREGNTWRDALGLVYRDGKLMRTTTLAEVRERANLPMLGDTKIAA